MIVSFVYVCVSIKSRESSQQSLFGKIKKETFPWSHPRAAVVVPFTSISRSHHFRHDKDRRMKSLFRHKHESAYIEHTRCDFSVVHTHVLQKWHSGYEVKESERWRKKESRENWKFQRSSSHIRRLLPISFLLFSYIFLTNVKSKYTRTHVGEPERESCQHKIWLWIASVFILLCGCGEILIHFVIIFIFKGCGVFLSTSRVASWYVLFWYQTMPSCGKNAMLAVKWNVENLIQPYIYSKKGFRLLKWIFEEIWNIESVEWQT